MKQRQLLIPTSLYFQYFVSIHLWLNTYHSRDEDEAPLWVSVEHVEEEQTLITIEATNDNVCNFWTEWISERLANADKIIQQQ